ncbi:MAG: TlpA family protein disulfide reductase [Bacteroidales bacterium]|nr:TlpA family protein disulfide reductase [Bacteroidales bacterium]
MKKLFVFITLSILLSSANAQSHKNITIKGTALNGQGRKVELLRVADQISQLEKTLDTCLIGDDRHFDLRCWSNYPMLVTMQIENYSQSFYVEPGKDYEVVIPSFNWNIDESRNIFLAPETLPVVFTNTAPDDINILIDSIDRVIASFIENNYFYFDQKFKPSPYYFDSLVATVNRLCPDSGNDFVDRYKLFQLASTKYSLKFASRKGMINTYIKNNPILYHDENYMALFATLYANSISKGLKGIPVHRLAHWVYNLDLDTYIDSIGTDPLLRHEQVRELAALQALQESYYNFRYYDADMVVKMIEKLAQRTKFAEHRTIANNILENLHKSDNEKVQERNLDFSLPDVDKKMMSLNSLKGKWIYIAFVRVSDPFSVSEVETMAHFHNNNSDDVVFVTIDCDREFQKMFHFLKNSRHGAKYDWPWLHFNGNYDLLRHFQITAYPWFVLINPDGKIAYDITPAPSSGFLVSPPWSKPDNDETPKSHLFKN